MQVRPPKEKVVCPFCHSANLSVTLQQTLSAEAIRERQAEEQRAQSAYTNAAATAATKGGDTSSSGEEQAPGFGSSLAMDENVALMRKRSSSLSDPSESDLSHLAMTVDERQALEARLRTQQQSPLIQRMQQEELERAFRNEREYLEQNAGRSNRRAATTSGRSSRRNRDWGRLIQAFEEGGGIQSMDDLAMLEAAMRMASMEHPNHRHHHRGTQADDAEEGGPSPLRRRMLDSRSHRGLGGDSSSGDGGGFGLATQLFMRGMSEEDQLAMAIAASLADSAPATTNSNSNTTEGESSAAPAESNDAEATNAGNIDVTNEATTETPATEQTTITETQESNTAGRRGSPRLVDLDVSLSESTDVAEITEVPPVQPAAVQVDEATTDDVMEEPSAEALVAESNEMIAETIIEEVQTERSTEAEDNDAPDSEETVEALSTAEISNGNVGRQGDTSIVTPEAPHTSPTEAVVAQTGLPVTEVLGIDEPHVPSSEVPAVEDAEANAEGEVPAVEDTPSLPIAEAEEATIDHSDTKGIDGEVVEEADAVIEEIGSSEGKSSEELKLPEADISEVPTDDSILRQESNEKPDETLESSSGMPCEA